MKRHKPNFTTTFASQFISNLNDTQWKKKTSFIHFILVIDLVLFWYLFIYI